MIRSQSGLTETVAGEDMRQASFAVSIAAFAIGGCSPALRCDGEGFIVSIDHQPPRVQAELRHRNANLALRRTKALFEDGDARALKEKAAGCS